MIVEPHILIPVTQIVGSFPCLRETVLKKQFGGAAGNINYPLVLGNIIHQIFQDILECMDFQKSKLGEIVSSAIS
jgi:CRISPR/Cas system-associated exonuclease Cas4 (RecB family)